MTEYLISMLSSRYHVAVLSRGYGRKTSGFVAAGEHTTVEEIGDEPFQYFCKFGDRVRVAVCEKRAEGFRSLLRLFPETNLILLDDAFQHRAVRPSCQVLLSDYHRPFYKDRPFPAGNLRERRRGAARADLVVVTKCPPDLTPAFKSGIKERVSAYTRPGTPVLFSTTAYGTPLTFTGTSSTKPSSPVIGVSGIAQNGIFEDYLKQEFSAEKHLAFPDHHFYTGADLQTLFSYTEKGYVVITTEKDMVKLKGAVLEAKQSGNFLYVPVKTDFGPEEALFRGQIGRHLSAFGDRQD